MTNWLTTFFSLPLECKSLTAIYLKGQKITYGELGRRINAMAKTLKKAGISKGMRVAFIGQNSLPCILVILALLQIEASPCILSTRIPKEMLLLRAKDAKTSFLVDLDSFSITRIGLEKEKEQHILLFTSGSSGTPKIACLTKEQFLKSAKSSIALLGLEPGKSCYLLSVPLFHVSGLSILFRCLSIGASITLENDQQITHISLVPTQLLRLIKEEKKNLYPKLQCLLLGGAPLGEDLLKKALEINLPIRTTYGMTETASQVTMSHSSDILIPLHLGKPLPGKEVQLSKENEILVKGNSLFSGYDAESGPFLPLLEGGWFATGDLGCFNSEGNLVYKGRKDSLFISGGENIYPEEIEKALTSLAGISLATVIPIEDSEFGEKPLAFIQTDLPLLNKKELQEKLSSLLPKFCIPIDFLPFPVKTPQNFKIQRKELKELARDLFINCK